ncbi:MAG: substrate-binding domain-containing protein [Eubacteriales bacterium]|jgi:LacI family transcriptional regulator|nr:substrate-binding domain-containing protein [Eubacteriales bacterium]
MEKTKRVTLMDVAEKSGYALRTVKKVMAGEPVYERTRSAVLHAARELDYQKNHVASALAKAKDSKVVVIYSETTKAYFPEVERGFRRFADDYREHGFQLEIRKCFTKSIADQEEAIRAVIADGSVSGLIIQPQSATKLNTLIEEFACSGRPVVTFGADAMTDKKLCYIGPNAYKAGRIGSQILANYIGKKGNVFTINQVHEHMQTKERKRGFLDMVKEYYPDIHSFELNIPDNSNLYYEMVKAAIVDENLRGLFCTDADSYIAGEVLRDLGRKDIVVVGFDLSEMGERLMKDGYLKVMIEQRPEIFSYNAARVMFNYLYYNEVPEKIQYSELAIITSECLQD